MYKMALYTLGSLHDILGITHTYYLITLSPKPNQLTQVALRI